MRRGAPLNSASAKVPVVGHVDDLESGVGGAAAASDPSGKYKRPSAYPPPPPPPPPPPYPGGGRSNSRMDTPAGMEIAPLTGGSVGSASSGAGGGGGGLSLSAADSTGKNRTSRVAHAYLTKTSNESLQTYGAILLVATVLMFLVLPLMAAILCLVYAAVLFGIIASLFLARAVLQKDDGTAEMRAVSDPIREGAEGFLHVQYTVSLLMSLT